MAGACYSGPWLHSNTFGWYGGNACWRQYGIIYVGYCGHGCGACNKPPALPTKIAIPVFVLSVIIDLGIIIASACIGFNAAAIF